jgi:type IV fimbrial biogenesis protein FimT
VTLIEMMCAVALIAVLGMLAVPSMADLGRDARRTAAVNDFYHALFLARSEAVRRGEMVSLCKSADGVSCSGKSTSWADGWLVFVNVDRDELPVLDPGETVLAVYSGWDSGTIRSNRHAYSFRPHTQGVVNGTLTFCDVRGSSEARAIIINHAGRPRIARRDSSGGPLLCP